MDASILTRRDNQAPVRRHAVSAGRKSRPCREAGGAACSANAGQHAIMFWVLTTLAMVVFAPCVLVPIWVESAGILEHEQSAAAAVRDVQAQADRNDARICALLADPLVNERIVRRELNYRPGGEEVVRWSSAEPPVLGLDVLEGAQGGAEDPAVEPPGWVTSLNHWLPAWPWRTLFAESHNRSLMLVTAGGLLAAAFLLYAPAPARSARGPR